MAFRLSPQKGIRFSLDEKQKKLLLILAGALVITLIVLYFNFFYSPSDSSEDAAVEPRGPGGTILEEISFDIDFLRDPFFKGSEFYGSDSLEVDERGRSDPFLPF